jgi:transcriptional regulator with XRE-family HTH domain
MKSEFEKSMEDPEFRRLFAQEQLLMQATEAICAEMARQGVNRTELAKRLGKSKGHVTRMLAGRNLTLRSLAEAAFALEMEVSLILSAPGQLKESMDGEYQQIAEPKQVARRVERLGFLVPTSTEWSNYAN